VSGFGEVPTDPGAHSLEPTMFQERVEPPFVGHLDRMAFRMTLERPESTLARRFLRRSAHVGFHGGVTEWT